MSIMKRPLPASRRCSRQDPRRSPMVLTVARLDVVGSAGVREFRNFRMRHQRRVTPFMPLPAGFLLIGVCSVLSNNRRAGWPEVTRLYGNLQSVPGLPQCRVRCMVLLSGVQGYR